MNGAGTKSDFSQGRAICRFSGLNDDPNGEFPEGGRVQFRGYSIVMNGLKALSPSPGLAMQDEQRFRHVGDVSVGPDALVGANRSSRLGGRCRPAQQSPRKGGHRFAQGLNLRSAPLKVLTIDTISPSSVM